MTRRFFLWLAGVGALVASSPLLRNLTSPVGPLSVGAIIGVSFPAVRDEYLSSKKRLFSGKVSFLSLGPVLTTIVGEEWKDFPIHEISTPVMWSKDQDSLSESEKVSLVRNLLVNGLDRHADSLSLLDERLHLIVSKEYHFWKADTFELGDGTQGFRIQTAYAQIPVGILG